MGIRQKLYFERRLLWELDCLKEYNQMFNENRVLYDPESDETDPGKFVEFSDLGDAFPHGIGGTSCIHNIVTPWHLSPHFID